MFMCPQFVKIPVTKLSCFDVKCGCNLLLFAGIDPPDADKEKMGILALQSRERDVPHSVRTPTHNNHICLLGYNV